MRKNRYIKRELEAKIKKLVKSFPAIVLTGPRQSGKSTTLRRLFGETHQYVTFDDPVGRAKCQEDPKLFLDNLEENVILDEIQYVPKILSYIKMAIDEDRKKTGRFIITGSQQFNLIKDLGDTLAGRAALLTLLPFNYLEIRNTVKTTNAENIFIRSCLRGSYPELMVSPKIDPSEWYAGYMQTYLERDVRGLHNVGNLSEFQRFIQLLAARCAQTINLSSYASDLGVAVNTIKNWLSILAASQIIFFLYPYYRNIGKRLIKSPKIYFNDCGLISYLTGLKTKEHILSGPLAGHLFENYVVSETNKILTGKGDVPRLYYIRTSKGEEIDLIIEKESRLYPYEIKLTKTPRRAMFAAIENLGSQIKGIDIAAGGLICLIKDKFPLTKNINAFNMIDYFKGIK